MMDREYDTAPECAWIDDDLADERAEDRQRIAFERMAEREYRDTGTLLVWGQDHDDEEGDA